MGAEFKNPFNPNVAIQFADISELPAFENVVAKIIDPNMTTAEKVAWEGRQNIKELIRYPKFNGRIADIELSPLEEPYAKLQTARENGWKIAVVALPGSHTEHDAQYRAERCLGFHFTANAKSSGLGTIGEIQAGLWYLPVTRRRDGSKLAHMQGGRSVLRVVTKPRLEEDNFIRLNEESARIAWATLRAAALHPRRMGLYGSP